VRYLFRTDHAQDLRLYVDGRALTVYGALIAAALLAPLVLSVFYVNELTYVFILAIAAIGLMVLTGYAGQVSLGHAAFLGIGAFAHGYFVKQGVPFVAALALATALNAVIGTIISFPLRRLSGLYMAMATYAVSVIAVEVFSGWEKVTGGLNGMSIPPASLFGLAMPRGPALYYLCLAILLCVVVLTLNLFRARTGKALAAIRDSEVAARCLGVNVAAVKGFAFGYSAALTGLAGALLGHHLGHISPEAFDFKISLLLLLMIVIGGLGTMRGAIIGAAIIGYLPQAIAVLRDSLPRSIAVQPALETGMFGLILVAVILFEPTGLVGRWEKIKLYFSLLPIYKKATFKRRRLFMKSQQVR